MYAEAMKLPLFRGDIKSSSVNTESDYKKKKTDQDEVEDLLELLSLMQSAPEQFYQITNELV